MTRTNLRVSYSLFAENKHVCHIYFHEIWGSHSGVVTPCELVNTYRRFVEACFLHLTVPEIQLSSLWFPNPEEGSSPLLRNAGIYQSACCDVTKHLNLPDSCFCHSKQTENMKEFLTFSLFRRITYQRECVLSYRALKVLFPLLWRHFPRGIAAGNKNILRSKPQLK